MSDTSDSLLADFNSHHIQGYAFAEAEKHGNVADHRSWFSVPLVTQVQGNLWTGGVKDGVQLVGDFKYVVSLFPWYKYRLQPGTVRHEYKLEDQAFMPDIHVLHTIARDVNEMAADGKTLVHCQAGLNRSGLVTALSLMMAGLPATEAIALLREKRSPMVLCNATFEEWLLRWTWKEAAA